jgi:hypothetical protein
MSDDAWCGANGCSDGCGSASHPVVAQVEVKANSETVFFHAIGPRVETMRFPKIWVNRIERVQPHHSRSFAASARRRGAKDKDEGMPSAPGVDAAMRGARAAANAAPAAPPLCAGDCGQGPLLHFTQRHFKTKVSKFS